MEVPERRGTSRVQLTATVTLRMAGDVITADAHVRDISLDGIFIRTQATVRVNSFCEITLVLTGTSSTLSLSGKGRIIRQDSNGVAIKFTEFDMDSYLHLKNIVLYNQSPGDG